MVGTVVLLPAFGDEDVDSTRRLIAAELAAHGYLIELLPSIDSISENDERLATAQWVASNAVELTRRQPQKPVYLVGFGASGVALPALGFSQKASRRPVAGYIVVDGSLPKVGAADWPDAPITYIASTVDDPNTQAASLRGWTVIHSAEIAGAIREAIDN